MEKLLRLSAPILLLFSLIVVSCRSQGLFPRVDVLYNYASNQPATATSTCGSSQPGSFCLPSQSDEQCLNQPFTCNATCPNGMDTPDYQDVLQAAQLHGGVSSKYYVFHWKLHPGACLTHLSSMVFVLRAFLEI